MIFVSDQAFISKWWWIGAIRKTRLPQRLKLNTWMITDSASIRKMPPIRSSRNSVFITIAKAASAPPMPVEPVREVHAVRGTGDDEEEQHIPGPRELQLAVDHRDVHARLEVAAMQHV